MTGPLLPATACLDDLLNSQIREICVRGPVGPKGNLAAGFAKLKVVHDQSRLVATVDVESRLGVGNNNSYAAPGSALQIDVGFVDSGVFLAQPIPRIVGRRNVLRGVIAPKLIVGAPVGGADVEALVMRTLRLHAKCNANEPA